MNFTRSQLLPLLTLGFVAAGNGFAWETGGKASWETFYRFNDSSALGRGLVELDTKHSLYKDEETEVEFNGEGRAWFTAAYKTQERDDYQFAPRNIYVTVTEEDLRFRFGYQILNWGETFGIPPTDLMNPRDYRNFDFLDSPKNKIAIPLLSVSYTLGEGNLQAFFSPKGNAPILPKSVGGVTVNQSKATTDWLQTFETGARFSYVLSSMNFDLSYLYQLNRFPALDVNPLAAGVELVPALKNVSVFGLGVSKGFEEVVLRADARYTFSNPVGITVTAPTRTFLDSHSVVVGADWTPAFVESFTLGVQAQLDRYPVPGASEQPAINFLARKSVWRDKVDFEAQYFQGLKLADRFLQMASTIKPWGTWQGRLIFQSFSPDPKSPAQILGKYDRIGGEISVSF